GYFVWRFRDDGYPGGEAILETFDVILSVIVVLVKDADLSVWMVGQEIPGIKVTFRLIARRPAHRPREVLWIVPLGGVGRQEEVRHLLHIHVFVNGGVRRGAQAVEDQEHLIALDELASLLDGLWRAIAVVVGDEPDLATVDSPLRVDLVEIGRLGL